MGDTSAPKVLGGGTFFGSKHELNLKVTRETIRDKPEAWALPQSYNY